MKQLLFFLNTLNRILKIHMYVHKVVFKEISLTKDWFILTVNLLRKEEKKTRGSLQ